MSGNTRCAHRPSIISTVSPVSARLCAPWFPFAVTFGAAVAGRPSTPRSQGARAKRDLLILGCELKEHVHCLKSQNGRGQQKLFCRLKVKRERGGESTYSYVGSASSWVT